MRHLQILIAIIWMPLVLSATAAELLVLTEQPLYSVPSGGQDYLLQKADGTTYYRSSSALQVTPLTPLLPDGIWIGRLQIPRDDELGTALEQLQSYPDLKVSPNLILTTDQMGDSLRSWQWGLDAVNADAAWETSTGTGVILAIIDTGIDYTHPDLRQALWINPGEDNGDGQVLIYDETLGWQLDPADLNGVDDDGNGLVDDLIGWDCTDAPDIPAEGDYRVQDGDPFDEHGHGTIVAGVIAATSNNGTGISGLAPDARLMILRAGGSSGYLQEDDVITALFYAWFMGARVINMSFGDDQVSPVMADVIRFLGSENILMVASAGNSGSDDLHYPSAFSGVLSVGASTRSDYRWPWSSYGHTLDLLAPGDSILTTLPGGTYGAISGTSLAAPFVTAAAGLLLARDPDRTASEISSLLQTSCRDRGVPGWDPEYGAGILDCAAALRNDQIGRARIESPVQGAVFNPAVISALPVIGTALGNSFARFEVHLGMGDVPSEWTLLAESTYQLRHDTLVVLDTEVLADTVWSCRLTMHLSSGQQLQDVVMFGVDRTAPVLERVASRRMLSAAGYGNEHHFVFSDPGTAVLEWACVDDGCVESLQSPYVSREHRFFLSQETVSGEYHYRVRFTGSNGDSLISEEWTAQPGDPFYPLPAQSQVIDLPTGYPLNRGTDVDHDGLHELWLSTGNGCPPVPQDLIPFEYDPLTDTFREQDYHYGASYVRDVADLDGDGLYEVLSEIAGISYIFTQTEPDRFPDQLAYRNPHHWLAGSMDTGNPAHGYPNLLCKTEVSPRQYFTARAVTIGDTSQTEIIFQDTLRNPDYPDGQPFTSGIARVVAADLDQDGFMDLVTSDGDGHFYVYEFTSPDPLLRFGSQADTLSGPLHRLAVVDDLVTGAPCLCSLYHTAPVNAEHEADGSSWVLLLYGAVGDNQYMLLDQLLLRGVVNSQNPATTLESHDLNGNGVRELILLIRPDLYVLQVQDGQFVPLYHRGDVCQQSVPAYDWDGNGVSELLVYNEAGWEKLEIDLDAASPVRPLITGAWPLGRSSLRLNWQHPGDDIDHFYLSLQSESSRRDTVIVASQRSLLWESLPVDNQCFLELSAVAGADTATASPVLVQLNAPPEITGVTWVQDDQFQMHFSEPMDLAVADPSNWLLYLEGRRIDLHSVALTPDRRETLVTLAAQVVAGSCLDLDPTRLRDEDRTPMQSGDLFPIDVPAADSPDFSVQEIAVLGDHLFRLQFSSTPDSCVYAVDTYSFDPGSIQVLHVEATSEAELTFRIEISGSVPLGAYGRAVSVDLSGIRSREGESLAVEQQSLYLVAVAADVRQMFLYPNPVVLHELSGEPGVMIAGLPVQAEIYIYQLDGRLLKVLQERDGDGGVFWDLTAEQGPVPTGVYLIMARADGHRVTRKLAVVR